MEFFKLFLTDHYTEEKINLLQCITAEHYKFFQRQVDKILFDVKLSMTLKEETFFRKNKDILRTISQRKFSSFVGYFLGSNINLVKEVIKVTHNESHPSHGAGSSGNMEKNQSQDAGTDVESRDTEPSSPESVSYIDEVVDVSQDSGSSSSANSSTWGGVEE